MRAKPELGFRYRLGLFSAVQVSMRRPRSPTSTPNIDLAHLLQRQFPLHLEPYSRKRLSGVLIMCTQAELLLNLINQKKVDPLYDPGKSVFQRRCKSVTIC